MREKSSTHNFIIIASVVAVVIFTVTFAIGITYVKSNPDIFSLEVKQSAVKPY